MTEKRLALLQRHEIFLQNLIQQANIPAPHLREAMAYSLLSGGKRFRPMLIYLTADVIGLSMEVADILAASVEMLHCHSLIHDDLPAMDNDDFRRGKPSCHRAFDEATAILAGDALAAWSVEVLLGLLPIHLQAPQVVAISLALLRASGPSGMISGQGLDLRELKGKPTDRDHLSFIHRLKTGCLINACVEMVLLAADKQSSLPGQALQGFAQDLGLAFQMQDDWLDRFANPSYLGKSRSSDVANAKNTFADLYNREELQQLVGKTFGQAASHLQIFGEKATALLQMTQQLQQRSLEAVQS